MLKHDRQDWQALDRVMGTARAAQVLKDADPSMVTGGLDTSKILVPETMVVEGPAVAAMGLAQGRQLKLISTPLDHVREIEAKYAPPIAWVRELEEIAPPSEAHPWFRLGWLDGNRKNPISRWVVYQMTPRALLSAEKAAQLGDTPWWKLPKREQQGRRQMVSAYQWEMYRKYQAWARPFWCLQGDQGGTPATYTELESKLLRLCEQETSPPSPGSLGYAQWDGRVAGAIRERHRLYRAAMTLERLHANPTSAELHAEAEAMEREFRVKFLAWFKERLAPNADFLTWYTKRTESDMTLRPPTEGEVMAGESMEETFIETGVVPVAFDSPDQLVPIPQPT